VYHVYDILWGYIVCYNYVNDKFLEYQYDDYDLVYNLEFDNFLLFIQIMWNSNRI